MKKVVLGLMILSVFGTFIWASNRDYIDLHSKSIAVTNNGIITIQRPSKFNNSIGLIKGIDKSVNLSNFTESQVNQEVIQFFEELVTQYKFKSVDRPYKV